MKITPYVKFVVNLAVGIGSAKIVHDVVANNVEPTTTLEKVNVAAGSIAIGGVVAEKTSDYTDRQIDAVADLFKQIKESQENN